MNAITFAGVLLVCMVMRLAAAPADEILLLDRAISGGPAGMFVAEAEFAGGAFRVGVAGETWIINTLRVWLVRPEKGGDGPFGRANSRIVLFGGIEGPAAAPGQAECACHDTIELRAASFQPDGDTANSSDVEVSVVSPGLAAVQFRRLRWSVPGGTSLAFGIFVEGRSGTERWRITGALEQSREARIFAKTGKLLRVYPATGSGMSIPVQVWGYKPATVVISGSLETINVTLQSSSGFDATRIDETTLRMGPLAAPALSVTVAGGGSGRRDIVARFPRAQSGLSETDVTACVTGRLSDGTPFEGCDLLRWR